MKKCLVILLIILNANPLFAASYYGCANAAINADSTFCTTPTGSCTGSDPLTAATVLAGTHTLYANGCTITIPESATVVATKLSNKDDGTDMVDGGQFTVSTTGWTSTTTSITAQIETGSTTGACLSITGSGNLDPVLTISSTSTTAGAAANMYGISDAHTAGDIHATIVGVAGSVNTAYAYRFSGATGTLSFQSGSKFTGVAAVGLSLSGGGSATLDGECIGSATSNIAPGCAAISTGTLTVTGHTKWGDGGSLSSAPFYGNVIYNPDASSYMLVPNGTDVYLSKAPSKSKVLSDTSVVNSGTGAYEAGTAPSSGGGAWAY